MSLSDATPKTEEFTPDHDDTDDDELLKWLDLGDTALGRKRKPAEPPAPEADLEKSELAE
jgi:hypothetical protein